jgi:hypothetical protein
MIILAQSIQWLSCCLVYNGHKQKAFIAWRTLNKNTYIEAKKKGMNLIQFI